MCSQPAIGTKVWPTRPVLIADFKAIFDASPLAIISYSLDRIVLAWNPVAERLLGWKAEEVVGREFPVPDSAKCQWLELQQKLAGGETFINVETRRFHKDGSEVDVIASGSPVFDSSGTVTGFISVLGDASQVLRMERALEVSEQRRLLAMQAGDAGSWCWNLKVNRIEWDSQCKRLFGVPEESVSIPFDDFFRLLHLDDQEPTREAVCRALTERVDYDMRHRVVWPDGSVHWLRCKGRIDDTQNPTSINGVTLDATWLKKSEELLRTNERLDAAAQVAHALAHEVNNPMEILSNTLYLIETELGTEHYALSAAQDAFDRISRITKQLLAVHGVRTRYEHVDVGSLADAVLTEFKDQLSERAITVKKEYNAAAIDGNPLDIRHLLTRVMENALENIVYGGTLRIHIRAAHEWVRDKRRGVRIVVADNGCGIGPDLHQKLFEPFVSSKSTKGSGLGLWICQTIAAKYGGSIRVRSRTSPGRSGTMVSVFLRGSPSVVAHVASPSKAEKITL